MSATAETLPAPVAGYDRLIELAVSGDADPAKLEKLLEIKQRHDADEARKAYFEAMRVVQSAGLQIKRESRNDQTNSAYAKLEAINRKLVPVYTDAGFSLSFSEEKAEKEKHVRVCCDIYHSAGHIEHKWAELPLDDSGIKGSVNKTGTHATGSTFSYARRYLTLMIFNLNTGDDDDGQQAGRTEIEELSFAYERAKLCAQTTRECFHSVYVIKQALRDKDWGVAYEARAELSDEEVKALGLAPTKGGIFTTEERDAMKSNEWSEARKAHHGIDE